VGSESAKKASKKARRTDRAGNGFLKEHSIIASHSICWHSHAGLSGKGRLKPVHPHQPGVGLVTTGPAGRDARPAVRNFGGTRYNDKNTTRQRSPAGLSGKGRMIRFPMDWRLP
jgi:hypothetical protein